MHVLMYSVDYSDYVLYAPGAHVLLELIGQWRH